MPPEEEAPAGAPDWVVTYGDLMSLLLTFFVMLFSMTEIQSNEKFSALQASMQRAFGSFTGAPSFFQDPLSQTEGPSVHGSGQGREKRGKNSRRQSVNAGPPGNDTRVATLRPGELWGSGGYVLFVEGSADLGESQRELLGEIAKSLAGKPWKISVRGHTSRLPLPKDADFADDWDLAYARSRAVAEALIELGLERDRIELDIVGRSEPAYKGTEEPQFAENSRVEVFLLDSYAAGFEDENAE